MADHPCTGWDHRYFGVSTFVACDVLMVIERLCGLEPDRGVRVVVTPLIEERTEILEF